MKGVGWSCICSACIGGGSLDVHTLLRQQLAEAQALKDAGCVVIGLACSAQLRSFGLMGVAHRGRAVVPAMTVLNAAAVWAFQCELFVGCTRLGRTPVIRQSDQIDTRHRRLWRYGRQLFHHDLWLDPIAPGKLAANYTCSG